ncbi:hypothetical protein FNV43_RR00537 [Rhamnella rubrinervis]|uniref:GDSL esterase/lipase At5g55050-like n=1 Tax=Rhamnella rubrinervis TaxID=2594499 RepID=A0A8K0HQK8_9ROSA|nr:hypothetical protein FNV43_RR00537 [Rhamnella rubrinervis]
MADYLNVFSAAVLGFFFFIVVTFSEGHKVPGIYVFGDSLVDVGNNNYFPTLARIDYPHNGIDFPTKIPTGRFSNGKNAADFLAEKVGLPTSPPYLSTLRPMLNKNNPSFLAGISFASGAAGILDITNLGLTISMNKQVEYYRTVYGEVVQQLGAIEAQKHLSESLFYIVIGSNDIIKYFNQFNIKLRPEEEFVDSLILTLKQQLKQLHNYGGRKFVVVGTGPIGCIPFERHKNKALECRQEVNSMSLKFNEGLKSMLQELKSELKEINYSYFDSYNFFLNFMQKPASYGFAEVKVACCGVVLDLDPKNLCRLTSSYCSNRSDHLFWDPYHPSEAASSIIVDHMFGGPLQYSFPFNVEQLIAL